MLRKVVNATWVLAAVPVANANAPQKPVGDEPVLKRPSDLSIYSSIVEEKKSNGSAERGPILSTIDGGIKVVREACCDTVRVVKDGKKPIDNFVSTGIEHSQFIYDYLNEPTNGIHRAGAIAVGSLAGYIIGIRRGFIRRLLYTSLGGLGVASVCYPKEASEYSQRAIAEAKTYATIVYNFAYGVKPGDDPKPIPIPGTVSELYGSVTKLFSSKKGD